MVPAVGAAAPLAKPWGPEAKSIKAKNKEIEELKKKIVQLEKGKPAQDKEGEVEDPGTCDHSKAVKECKAYLAKMHQAVGRGRKQQ